MSSSTQDIAIVGMAVEVPGAADPAAFWDVIAAGRSLTRPFPARRRRDIEEFTRFIRDTAVSGWGDATGVAFHDGSYLDRIDAFDHEFFEMTPRQAAVTDPHQRLVLRTMYRALEDAGYVGERLTGSRTGVFVGFAANPGGAYFDYFSRIDATLGQLGVTGNIPTMLANRLSYLFDLHGPSMTIDSACSASLVATHHARSALLMGDCDMAVVAGTRVVLFPVDHPYTRIGIESSDGVTRTFDDSADGTGYGEGSGVVVLKRLETAIADGDQVYAVIKGSAVNHDGRSEAMTSPDADAQVRLLTDAWRGAGVDPRTIGYVEVHGTATRIGDPIEFDGLSRAFRASTDDRQFCAVGTVKANIGHLFEGSGVMGLIKGALTLQRAQIPPLANFVEPNARLDFAGSPLRVPTELQEWPAGDTPRRAGVSAFGLGGTNAHVVLEEWIPPATGPAAAGPYLFTLSARTERSLRRSARALLGRLDQGEITADLADICYTAALSRSHHPVRLAFVADDRAGLRAGLDATLRKAPVPEPVLDPPRAAALAALGATWSAGGDADPLSQFTDRPGRRPRVVRLTPYQYDESRSWVDFPDDWATRLPAGPSRGVEPATFAITFEPIEAAAPATGAASVIALVDPGTRARAMLEPALPDARFAELTEVPPETELTALVEQVIAEERTHLVYALGFEDKPAGDVAEFDRRVEKNLVGLFRLTKALMQGGARVTLVVATQSALALEPGETGLVTENAALAGFGKAAVREYPHLALRVLDVDADVTPDRLRDELLAGAPGVFVLRGDRVHAETVTEIAAGPADAPGTPGDYLTPGGAYLFTGGTGGIAMAVAGDFARRQPDIDLYLLSRSGLPDRSEWEALLDGDPGTGEAGGDVGRERIRAVLDIEATGARVHLVRADAADPDALRHAVREIQERHGRVAGVVHAAGVPGENLIVFRETDDVRSLIAPKMRGAFVLGQLLRVDRPDFVVHMSSVAAVFPGIGQADYAAANYYLDTLAVAAEPGTRVLAVDWVAWRDTGMAVATGANEDTAFKAMPTPLGVELLDAGLRTDRPRFLAGRINYDSELAHVATTYELRLSETLGTKIDVAVASMADRLHRAAANARRAVLSVAVELSGRDSGQYTDLERLIARCLAHALGTSRVVVDANFQDLGVDSITVLGITTNLSAVLGFDVDPVDLLMSPTVESFAEVIETQYGGLPAELDEI